jgi:hypothetical protein
MLLRGLLRLAHKFQRQFGRMSTMHYFSAATVHENLARVVVVDVFSAPEPRCYCSDQAGGDREA